MIAPDIQAILQQVTARDGASAESIEAVNKHYDNKLPDEYAQTLVYSNGFEGPLGDNEYIVVWRVEDIIEFNKDYCVSDRAPGLLLFGSDGSDTAYAFDLNLTDVPIVTVSFLSMSSKDAIPVAQTFYGLLRQLAIK